ncbi:LPS export ABC transporter permease LptF [Lichenicoccus roseus]|uniref:LPS export ABC transporter permease LptF n=1 Tax=Lichenicoccus roseus TaxID=2683649 RepID=A0A5R9J8K5_9PROT|nr:LPS export ABC transporter permease LptF [Lichenicoccus roseus]TLU73922.1 LPS export ABC transporter permease LptF [Lichenicoccus roseus]
MIALQATRLDRYVLRQLLGALLASTGGLAALIWLTQSLRFVAMVVDRGLSLRVFLQLTGLLIPSFVAVILPITTFVVIQFIYQRLAGDRELTVMRAAGLSSSAIARPALACAGISVVLSYVLNLWIVPTSYHDFREYEFEIRNKMAAFLLQEGVFTRVSDTMTVYIRTRDHDGTLHGIMVEDDRTKNSRATILAEHGTLVAGDGPPRVVLFNGSREEIDRTTGRLNVLTFARNTIDLAGNNKDETRYRDSTEMSLGELLDPDPHVVAARDRGKFAVEAHRRLTAPLTAFSFAMVALVAVLMGAFSRHGGMIRPMVAILVVVGLLAIGLVVQNIAARDPVLIPLIWMVAILPGIMGAAMLFGPEWRFRHETDRRDGVARLSSARVGSA